MFYAKANFMTQSKRMSMIETITSIIVGFVVSMLVTYIVFPMYGHTVTFADNLEITSIFTVTSFVRGYCIRRVFA